MKRLSTFVLASIVACATYALPLREADRFETSVPQQTTSATFLSATHHSGMEEAPTLVQVNEETEKAQMAEFIKSQRAFERNILTQTVRKSLKHAATAAEGDTVVVEPDSFNPTYYPSSGDWLWMFYSTDKKIYMQFDYYHFPADNPLGTFTEADLDPFYTYVVNYTAGAFEDVSTCTVTLSQKKVSDNLSLTIVDGLVNGSKGTVYVLKGEIETLTPQDTVELTVEGATIAMTTDSTALLKGQNDEVSVEANLTATSLVNTFEQSKFDLENTTLVVKGDTLGIWEIGAKVTVNADMNALSADLTVLTLDTVVYNITLVSPLVLKDTVETTLPNMVIDDRYAAWFGMYFITGSAEGISYRASTTKIEAGMYSMAVGNLGINLNIYGSQAEVWGGTLDLQYSADGDATADAVVLTSDLVLYKFHLCWAVPEPKDTVSIVFEHRAEANASLESGLIQLVGSNDSARIAVATIGWKLGQNSTISAETALLDYSFVTRYIGNDTISVAAAAISGMVQQLGDTIKMTASLICFDSIQYDVELWYAVPTPTETVNLGFITDVTFVNAMSNNQYQLRGATADSTWMVSFVPASTETVEGEFVNDGYFSSDFISRYTWVYDAKNDEFYEVLAAKVTVFMDETKLIIANCDYICSDDKRYTFTMKGKYERVHISYDTEDPTPVNLTFTTASHQFAADAEYVSEGALNFYALGLENTDYLRLQFVVEPNAELPACVIPAGVYPINKSYEPGTCPSGDFDGEYIYPCFFGQTSEDGKYLSTKGMYYLVDGTVTVETVGESDLHIVVDAVNSYDTPVKIDINTVVTGIESVEAETLVPLKKFLQDGVLLIQRGDRIYNLTGAQVK